MGNGDRYPGWVPEPMTEFMPQRRGEHREGDPEREYSIFKCPHGCQASIRVLTDSIEKSKNKRIDSHLRSCPNFTGVVPPKQTRTPRKHQPVTEGSDVQPAAATPAVAIGVPAIGVPARGPSYNEKMGGVFVCVAIPSPDHSSDDDTYKKMKGFARGSWGAEQEIADLKEQIARLSTTQAFDRAASAAASAASAARQAANEREIANIKRHIPLSSRYVEECLRREDESGEDVVVGEDCGREWKRVFKAAGKMHPDKTNVCSREDVARLIRGPECICELCNCVRSRGRSLLRGKKTPSPEEATIAVNGMRDALREW